jgi:peptide-methionine (R)-S-oxide reductase
MVKDDLPRSEKEWEKLLKPEVYQMLWEKHTESPFTGKFLYNKEKGVYVCAGCDNPLFSSDTKFDSGSGWPSFWDVISKDSVELEPDYSFGMKRVEVVCSCCGGHLDHVFDDGSPPTGNHFCINSLSFIFLKKVKIIFYSLYDPVF